MQKALDDELMEDDMLPQLACTTIRRFGYAPNESGCRIIYVINCHHGQRALPAISSLSNLFLQPRYTASVRVLAGGEILDAFGFPVGDGSRLPRLQTSHDGVVSLDGIVLLVTPSGP